MLDSAGSGTRPDPNALDPTGSGSSMILAFQCVKLLTMSPMTYHKKFEFCVVKTSFHVRINS